MTLPKSVVAQPWALVKHGPTLRLAYITKLFGGGACMGPCQGGRGYLCDDAGHPTDDEETVFKATDLVYEWQVKPSAANLARQRGNRDVSLRSEVLAV